jgi:hypothetical protein
MKCNMGKYDRGIRAVVGIVIVVLGIYFTSWWGLVGLILLGTAALGWCPAYVPFKFSTVKKEKT